MKKLTVRWKLDKYSPFEEGAISYSIAPLQTEIVFPTGKTMTFPNWEVKGCRETHYMEQWVNISPDEYLKIQQMLGKEIEHGILIGDIRRFIQELALKAKFENLFWQPTPGSLAYGAGI